MKLFFFLVCIYYTYTQNIFKLTPISSTKNNIEMYGSIRAVLSKSGLKYAVYEMSNTTCYIFNEKSELINFFGKKGNGPNEFSDYNFLISFSNDKLLFKQHMSYTIYNMDGTAHKSLKEKGVYLSTSNKRYLFDIFKSGRNNHNNGILELNSAYEVVNKYEINIVNNTTKSLFEYNAQGLFNKNIIRSTRNSYKLDIFDMNYNYLFSYHDQTFKVYTKHFKPIRGNKKLAAMMAGLREAAKFVPPIAGFIGVSKKHLFIRINTKNKKICRIDVFNEKMKRVQQLKISLPKNTKVYSADIKKNRFVLSLENNEIGSYVDVYNIEYLL